METVMTETKITEELVLLIRGFFSLPLMSALGRTGALERMLSRPKFTVADFQELPNKKLLYDALNYFSRIGLLEYANVKKEVFKTTELGVQVFRRISSFYAPHSYREYLHNFHEQLLNPGAYEKQEVDRLENIIGSGRTHERYFPPAVSYLKRKADFDLMVDIGCGDGRFLEFVLRSIPDKKIIGIDLSEISVKETLKNLKAKFPKRNIQTFCSDAADIQKWSRYVLDHAASDKIAISMWFLLHEISRREPKNVIQFLTRVHQLFPKAQLVVCELVRQTPELLTKFRKELVMPEYLLFHDLSGQGVLSWQDYQMILKKTPYKLVSQRLFDEIGDRQDSKEPATFVWCLDPK